MHYKIDFTTFLPPKNLMPGTIQNAFTDLLTVAIAQGNYIIKKGIYEIKKQSYSCTITLAQSVAISCDTTSTVTNWQIIPYTRPLGEKGCFGTLYVTNIHYTLMMDSAKNQLVLHVNESSEPNERVIKTQSVLKHKKGKGEELANIAREAELGGRVKKLKMHPLILSADGRKTALIMLRQPGDTVFNFYNNNKDLFYKDEFFFLEFILNLEITYFEDIAKNHIIHNDIKPENILIATPFNFSIIDFGFAMDSSEKTEGKTFGSQPYISPEGLEGKNRTSKSDIYSLGRTFIALLGFSHRTKGKDGGFIFNTNYQQLEIPQCYSDAIKQPLKDYLLSMLAKAPDERPDIELLIQGIRDILVIARTNKAQKDLKATQTISPQQTQSLSLNQEKEKLSITKVSIFSHKSQTPVPVHEGTLMNGNMEPN